MVGSGLVLLIICLFNNVRLGTCQDACVTPERTPGTCIVLTQCSVLYEPLQAARPAQRPPIQRQLQRYNCGYEGALPKVCCSSNTITPPVTQPVTPASTPPTSNGGVYRRPPPDVSNHRNLALLPTECGSSNDDRIVNGNITGVLDYQWMVALSYTTRGSTAFRCGGTLINSRYVLTAAHCLVNLRGAVLTSARIGEHDTRTDPDCQRVAGGQICAQPKEDFDIELSIPHPSYSPTTLQNDIGLIRLSRAVNRPDIPVICLPSTRETANLQLNGLTGVVTGWGNTELGVASAVLLQANLPVMDNQRCGEIHNRSVPVGYTQFCAGGEPGIDSCSGDSGGPFKILVEDSPRLVQYGIVSFGLRNCGTSGVPGVYTSVPYFMDWILNEIRP